MSSTLQLTAQERFESSWLIHRALEEDRCDHDLTSDILFPAEPSPLRVMARCVSRQAGVICGVPVAEEVYSRVDPDVEFAPLCDDGRKLEPGDVVFEVRGAAASVLRAERVVLNFLQRLSGIASLTARWVEAIRDSRATLLDTRKTTPGWRHLEKYAVRAGGGENHRRDLADGMMVKDNHAWVLRRSGRDRPREWVERLRQQAPGVFLEVEVDSRAEFLAVRELDVDAILLDNFSPEDLRWAVEENHSRGEPRPLLEASGGLHLDTAREVAATGVDRISVGALTHSARALDLSLECCELMEST